MHEYNFFEEAGVKMENHYLYSKWAVVVGIREDTQVARRVQVTKAFKLEAISCSRNNITDSDKIKIAIGWRSP